MRKASTLILVALVALLALGLGTLVSRAGEEASKDRLAEEIASASAVLQGHTETQGLWAETRKSSQPVLARAQKDLSAGRRVVAMQRIASVKASLATAAYLERSEAHSKDEAAFEAEWKRMGGVLRADLGKPSSTAFLGVEPAAVRALAEGTMPQVRLYYESSLEYGQASMPGDGLYYLATAQARREAVSLYRELATRTERRPPPLRALTAELDGLQADILKAYRPPAMIDRHGEFIGASAALKEARELDSAGLRYGALLKYLQAAQRIAPLSSETSALDAQALAKRLDEFDRRLAAGDVDHSVGRLFLETARADLADAEAGTTPPSAVWIASDVLSRYFAALEPARPVAPPPAPQVTVTLIRWPYT
jgi:hypothetical protein